MGGNAIKTVKTSRFDLSTYNETKELIKNKLSEYLVIDFTLDVPGKQDFGDIDVLYQKKEASNNIFDIIREVFNPIESHINGGVLSFAYLKNEKYYQIDMIEADNIECFKFYLSYGDFGNIVGKMLKHYEIHLGMQGLFVKPIIGGSTKQIILTRDPNKICDFLGVSYNDWLSFKTIDEIFEFIISIKFFNKNIFFENLKYNDKVKIDRLMYQTFLAFIKDMDKTSSIEKKDMTQELIVEFNKTDVLLKYINEHEVEKSRRTKFNSNKFTKYGFEGKEIGITMKYFKKYIENGLNIDFNNWLDSHDEETIEKYIDYYETH